MSKFAKANKKFWYCQCGLWCPVGQMECLACKRQEPCIVETRYFRVLMERTIDVQASSEEEAVSKARINFIEYISELRINPFDCVWEVSADG